MVVRIRFTRLGRKGRPFYRIVAADSRSPRDGKFIEIVRLFPSRAAMLTRFAPQLGTYDPIASPDGVKEVRLKADRVRYWMGVGAQPSETVAKLLGRVSVLPPYPVRLRPKQMVPKELRTAEGQKQAEKSS